MRTECGCGSVERTGCCPELIEIAIDKAGIKFALAKSRRTTKCRQKPGIIAWANHDSAIERVSEPIKRRYARLFMDDEFGDHRVIKWRHLVASLHAAVDPKTLRLGELQCDQTTRGRQEASFGIFRIEPRFNGVAIEPDLRLREWQLFTSGNPELPLHQIKSCDCFSHRMLDL